MSLHYGQTKDINSILAKCERGEISNVIHALTIVLDLINLNHLIVADDKKVWEWIIHGSLFCELILYSSVNVWAELSIEDKEVNVWLVMTALYKHLKMKFLCVRSQSYMCSYVKSKVSDLIIRAALYHRYSSFVK